MTDPLSQKTIVSGKLKQVKISGSCKTLYNIIHLGTHLQYQRPFLPLLIYLQKNIMCRNHKMLFKLHSVTKFRTPWSSIRYPTFRGSHRMSLQTVGNVSKCTVKELFETWPLSQQRIHLIFFTNVSTVFGSSFELIPICLDCVTRQKTVCVGSLDNCPQTQTDMLPSTKIAASHWSCPA